MIVGSVYKTVKLASLEMKWQQKKQNNLQKNKAEMTAEERQLQMLQEDAENLRKSNDAARIYAKIKAGEELTPDEISYLRQNNPQALTRYEEIMKEAAAYEERLKNCKTKDEVDQLNTRKMGEFLAQVKSVSNDPYIPEGKKLELLDAINAKMNHAKKAYARFVQSALYVSLPTEEEKQEKAKEQTLDMGPELVDQVSEGADISQGMKTADIPQMPETAGMPQERESQVVRMPREQESQVVRMPREQEIRKRGSHSI